MEVYTTGFTKKTAPQFFDALKDAGVRRLLDVRLSKQYPPGEGSDMG